MPNETFLLLPFNGTPAGGAKIPSVRDHAVELAKVYEKEELKRNKPARNPDEDCPPEDSESSEEDYGGYRYGRRDNARGPPAALKRFHDGKSFCSVLSWSQGSGRGGYRGRRRGGRGGNDVSMTLWFDDDTPKAYVACLRGEVFPFALMRGFMAAEGGRFKVDERILENAVVTSVSTGGSGGENRFTVNLSIGASKITTKNTVIDIATGDIVSESSGSYDSAANEGKRSGASNVPTLSQYCEQYVTSNSEIFSPHDLINLIHLGVATNPSDLGIDRSILTIPMRGRRLTVSADGKVHEIFLKTLTVEALRQAALEAVKGKVNESEIEGFFRTDDRGRWIEILKDEQVELLVADSNITIVMKEDPEEVAKREEQNE